ncbi:MAG: ATP-binding cassette domain-containing protein, partial [Rhodobacteraceae bacterium]|nr:ATP-binding cassette domain-containing protein [Paracoccaceae bacterium]
MTNALVVADRITLGYGGRTVLQDVSLAVDPGEIITIVGPNGSGKSSLLRALIGALVPTEGCVTQQPGLRIGYVPQRLAIDGSLPLTVTRFLNLPRRVSRRTAAAALDQAGVPALGRRQMVQLSGGQFQRVLLARALLSGPHLLLLDEATQSLDPSATATFYQQIEAVRRGLGCAVVMVSHDLHVV